MKNTRTYQKRSTIKDIKREPQGDDEERLSHLIVRPIPLGGWPTNITITAAEVLLKKPGVWVLHPGSPAWVFCTREIGPHNIWLWRPPGLLLGDIEDGGKQRFHPLRAHTKILHAPGPRAEAASWKKPGSNPSANLNLPKEENTIRAHSGHTAAIWEIWFYHRYAVSGKGHCQNIQPDDPHSSLTCQYRDPRPYIASHVRNWLCPPPSWH